MGIKKITISREGLFFTDDTCYELKYLFMETVMKRYFFLMSKTCDYCFFATYLRS